MKQNLRRGIAFLLCLALCFSLTINVFASNELGISYTATLSQSTVNASDEDQTVDLTIGTSAPVTLDSIEVIVSDASGKLVVGTPSGYPNGGTASYNDKANKLSWMNLGDDNIEDVTTLAVFPLTIPANTPAGDYVINVTGIKLSKDWGTTWEDGGSAAAVLTVKDNAPAAEGYTVAVSGNAVIRTGDEGQIKLNVTHSDAAETSYAAYSMKVSYNKDVLTYKSFGDTAAAVTEDAANGILTIYRYGEDLTLGEDLILTFTGRNGGESAVQVTEAKVDKTENALRNAPAAAVTGAGTITVSQTYDVSRDTRVVDGEAKAEAGRDYTFKLVNGLDGSCMTVSYTVGGVDKGTLTQGADGSYTIPAGEITGDITITAVGKTYTVTKAGTGADDVTLTGDSATYGTDYTFALDKTGNYAYAVEVTAGGKTVTPALGADGRTYTITGTEITGDVVITVTRTENAAQINFTGSGAAEVVKGISQTAEPGTDFAFSITKEDGYEYTVTAAKKAGSAITVKDNGDGTYTIAGADIAAGDVITVTVEKKAAEVKYTVTVTEYLKLQEDAEGTPRSMFLITAKLNEGVTLAEGKVLAYGNNAMFRSAERYDGAYAYLVISDQTVDEVKAEAAGKITEVDAAAQTIRTDGDVNGTGLVDINDAQLAYNIYNAKYGSFDTTTMEMFMAADMNGNGKIDTNDAAAIVTVLQNQQ